MSSSTTDRATTYARRVVDGLVIAGPHVRNACRRHLDDLVNGEARGIYFDEDEAARAIRFFESKLRLSEGQFEGRPLILHESQAFIVGSLFGWRRESQDHGWIRRFRRAYIEQGKGNGKALALDTVIPTPQGWREMRDLRAGDQVFDELGHPCNVTGATEVMENHECYRVVFSDGAVIIADADHLWVTSALRTGLPKGPKPKDAPRKGMPALRTTAEIAATLTMPVSSSAHPQAKWNHRVDIAGPLDLPDVDLPIPPYTFGAWLGDGNSADARLTVAYDDWEVVEAIQSEGVQVAERAKHSETTARVVLGSGGRAQAARNTSMQAKLRQLSVLGSKHIPELYLWASDAQRLALLQGIMDTDGTIAKNGQAELTLCCERLALDAVKLIRSLGFKPTMKSSDSKLNGRTVGTRYRIQFWAYTGRPIFRLKRKAVRQKTKPASRSLSEGRMIVGCERVSSVPVRCISVDSPSRMYLAGEHLVPTHNSPVAGGIGLYGLMADKEPGAEIYSAGATKDQAAILFRDAIKMRAQSPDILARTKTSGGEGREFNLAYLAKGSFFRPISREARKTGSGPRPHMALCDEVHEHPDRGVMEMLERGFKFRRQPLLLMITNSGTDRLSICWEEHEHAVKVAAGNWDAKDEDAPYLGEAVDDTTFSFVCALDKDDDPLRDPSCWPKANPLLGVTITEEYLAGVVAQAKAMPGKLNGILRLHFCRWTDAQTAWMTRETLEPCIADFDPAIHRGKRVSIGLDLSQNRDITAKANVVETGTVEVKVMVDGKPQIVSRPTYDAWIEAWTPCDTLAAREIEDKLPYQVWVKQGHLQAPKGQSVRFDHVAQAIAEDSIDYEIGAIGYDRYAFRRFEEECQALGLDLPFIEHPQGGTKKGKPTEGMKDEAKRDGKEAEGLWMPGSLRMLEEAILERRIRIKRNPVLISAMMSAVTDEDRWENRWLAKERSTNKIDPAVALCMALGTTRAVASRPQFQMLVI